MDWDTFKTAPSNYRWLQHRQQRENANRKEGWEYTFQMEKDIGLIILEHLCHQFDIHVLDIDLLVA